MNIDTVCAILNFLSPFFWFGAALLFSIHITNLMREIVVIRKSLHWNGVELAELWTSLENVEKEIKELKK